MTDTLLLALSRNIRITLFLGVLAAMALWELAAPRRRQDIPRLLLRAELEIRAHRPWCPHERARALPHAPMMPLGV